MAADGEQGESDKKDGEMRATIAPVEHTPDNAKMIIKEDGEVDFVLPAKSAADTEADIKFEIADIDIEQNNAHNSRNEEEALQR